MKIIILSAFVILISYQIYLNLSDEKVTHSLSTQTTKLPNDNKGIEKKLDLPPDSSPKNSISDDTPYDEGSTSYDVGRAQEDQSTPVPDTGSLSMDVGSQRGKPLDGGSQISPNSDTGSQISPNSDTGS